VRVSGGGPPSGVVTFLFTDIEGSTRRWESDADLMRKALAAHDEVLRSAIEAQGGWLFKHTGDGVCAAFASPRSAVDAQSGVKGVVGSLWSVNDASTAELIKRFYQLWRTEGLTAPAAPCRAQAWMASGNSGLPSGSDPTHPEAWAPFVYIGA
jgi:class 3 adenylate cyclase